MSDDEMNGTYNEHKKRVRFADQHTIYFLEEEQDVRDYRRYYQFFKADKQRKKDTQQYFEQLLGPVLQRQYNISVIVKEKHDLINRFRLLNVSTSFV